VDLLEVVPVTPLTSIIPISELRQDAAAVLKSVRSAKAPLIITQRGRAAAVVLSVEVYERGERERELLLMLARGEKDIAAGKGHDLSDVLKDAKALISKHRP
jgi:prevent-host-death family protein